MLPPTDFSLHLVQETVRRLGEWLSRGQRGLRLVYCYASQHLHMCVFVDHQVFQRHYLRLTTANLSVWLMILTDRDLLRPPCCFIMTLNLDVPAYLKHCR
ncbi:unnamed protein product [Effrenium voratum]|nr:unnamed protein product [Effrenium voratum]